MTANARPVAQLLAFACSTFFAADPAWAQAPLPVPSAAFPPTPPTPPPSASSPPTVAPPQPAPAPPAPPPAPPLANDTQYVREPSPPPVNPEPPPPPPQNPNEGFNVPEISVRVDPFNWLLEGRFGLELESQVYKFLSLEIVPVFVTTSSPPTLNYDSFSSVLRQSSNGVGAISGAAIDAGFWFNGKPFRGNVLRLGFTNYAYRYDTSDSGVAIDSVSHTDREFFALLGQHSRWGAFTIAGGIGLGYELNQANRCFDALGAVTSDCPKNQLLIKLDQRGSVANLDGFLYPFDLLARFSLGVVF